MEGDRMVSIEPLVELVQTCNSVTVCGSGSKHWLCPPPEGAKLDMAPYAGIVELSPDDQVVVVRAGTTMDHLQSELAEYGLCLPLPDSAEFGNAPAGLPGTVGGGIAMSLPHGLESQCGNWRDWVLGLSLLRPDGTTAKCGSKAVKNVAGYDVARLMVGSRGTLGVILEATLKVYPRAAMPRCDVKGHSHWANPREIGWKAIARFDARSFSESLDALGEWVEARDDATRTLWLGGPFAAPAIKGARAVWSSADVAPRVSAQEAALMERARLIFDPDQKLNPRVFGR